MATGKFQNRERTGVPTRAARVGWWMRSDRGTLGRQVLIPSLSLGVLTHPPGTACYTPTWKMAEFIVRLGTPAGEIVTRTVEALAANEARVRLEREGFKVFAVTPPKAEGVASLTRAGGVGGQTRVKANDFLLFNQH